MLRVAIIEDSPTDRENLQKFLTRYESEKGTEIKADVFDRAETFLQGYKPVYDVIFMDICLPYMSGMDACVQLRKLDKEVAIIFTTDMIQYAIDGYKVDALDYFVKPVMYFDLKLRLDKLMLHNEVRQAPVLIHIPYEGDVVISASDVKFIEVMDKDLTYHTTNGDYTVRGNGLKKLEDDLKTANFCRCSSSYLINLKWCTRLKGDNVLVGNDWIKISRGMKKEFVTRLSEVLSKVNLRGGA